MQYEERFGKMGRKPINCAAISFWRESWSVAAATILSIDKIAAVLGRAENLAVLGFPYKFVSRHQMQVPFTVEQFFDVFRDYNDAVWPAQLFLLGLALAALIATFVPRSWSGVIVSLILAFLWVWLAVAYHFLFFSRINPLAYVFGAVSLAGALVLGWQGVIRRRLRFRWAGGARAMTGVLLVVFALVVYPLWSWFAGHRYPAMPTFGLPCPTTIFTLGMLAFLATPHPRSPFVVPILWCAVGAQAAILLGVPQDFALVVAGIVGLALLTTANRGRTPQPIAP
jgi:hypothetical protein